MATVPPYPNLKSVTPISPTEFRVVITSRGTGGSPILEWQIGYGTNGVGPTYSTMSDGDTIVGGFNSGQSVFFWARVRNAIGWSAWSYRRSATTFKGPVAPSAVSFSNVTQTSATGRFTDKKNDKNNIIERQIAYGLDPNTPTDSITATTGVASLTNLQAGKVYYVWARSRNSLGWGPYSTRSILNLIAGARIFTVPGGWRKAVPYVRVDGVWRRVQPYVKAAGVWRKTQ